MRPQHALIGRTTRLQKPADGLSSSEDALDDTECGREGAMDVFFGGACEFNAAADAIEALEDGCIDPVGSLLDALTRSKLSADSRHRRRWIC